MLLFLSRALKQDDVTAKSWEADYFRFNALRATGSSFDDFFPWRIKDSPRFSSAERSVLSVAT